MKIRSKWREFEYIFMAVRNAIVPYIELGHVIYDWPRIRNNLAENHRNRGLQMNYIDQLSYCS